MHVVLGPAFPIATYSVPPVRDDSKSILTQILSYHSLLLLTYPAIAPAY